MPYVIIKSDGTTLTTIPDGQFDITSTSLNLIGKNVFNYGLLQNENFVRLLENFSNSSAPLNQLKGQLWFDTNTNSLKLYNGSQWKGLSTFSISTNTSASLELGNIWYDVINGQLSINTGTALAVIGPEAVAGFDTTRMVSTKIRDTSDVYHPVILTYLDGEVITIITKTSFEINALDAITGFTTLTRGINLKNAPLADVVLRGAATSATFATTLLNASSSSFITASILADAETIVQRDSNADITVNGLIATEITTLTTGTLVGQWSVTNDLLPTVNAGVNLGSNSLRWGSTYLTFLDSPQINAGVINFTSIVDPFLISIERFDTDISLSANSNGRIPTQRAIKTYIDNIVGTTPGYAGSAGGQGFTGSRGDQGFNGSRGFNGFTGSRGTDGTSVKIVGSVPSNSFLPIPYLGNIGDAFITTNTGNLWSWTGSSWVDVGNIRGPIGEQGYTGSQGPIGNTGFTGSRGVGFTGSRGADGTSVRIIGSVANSGALPTPYGGDIGDGYITSNTGNLWVWNGSTWNDVGNITGPAGAPGFTGSQGLNGFAGSRGDFGPQGPPGYTGSKGDSGFTGSASTVPGPTGSVGYTGSQGDTGFTGSVSTVPGPEGPQGPIGYTGSAGTGSSLTLAPPLLYHVTSGYTNGGRVIVKNTTPTSADVDGNLEVGDIWFDPSGSTGFSQSASTNGWTRLPNGILLQWGRFQTSTAFKEGVVGPINFNTNFAGTPWSVVATPLIINSNTAADGWVQMITSSITASQFSIMSQRENNSDQGINGFTWFAIGPG